MTGENGTRYVVVLECKHDLFFQAPAPKVNDWLYCIKCRKESTVILAPEEWRVRCIDCLFSRRFGSSESDANMSVGRHRRKFPDHQMKIFNGNKLIRTAGNRNQTVMF